MNKLYDTNFYYPSSAGKGIDIYLIDSGIIVDHEDFDTSDRTITCDAIVINEEVRPTTKKEKTKCFAEGVSPNHGIMTSSNAGGKLYGIAKKANLHMVAIDFKGNCSLMGLDFVLKNAKSPHKTVINMSLGGGAYSKANEDKLTDLINEGFTIIASAGNHKTNCCEPITSENFSAIAGYNKTIIVGGVTTNLYGDGYYRINYSNYGKCVDIFAPAETICADALNGFKAVRGGGGTSASSPIVSGVAATIMSEHP
ncbi:subtilisin-like protein, partial [Anaeromyces robustus]